MLLPSFHSYWLAPYWKITILIHETLANCLNSLLPTSLFFLLRRCFLAFKWSMLKLNHYANQERTADAIYMFKRNWMLESSARVLSTSTRPKAEVSNSSPGGPLCLLVFWLFSAPLVHSSHWLAKEWTHLGLQALIDSWLKGNHKNLQTLRPSGDSVWHPWPIGLPSMTSP